MLDKFEYHYVVSYREGMGWGIAADVESAVFPDGTVYDWTQGEGWRLVGDDLETLDLDHYSMLKSVLNLLNEGIANA